MPKRSIRVMPDGTVRELPRGVAWNKAKQQYQVQYADVNGEKRRELYDSLTKATAVAKERRATVKRVRLEGRAPDPEPAARPGRNAGETLLEYVERHAQEHPKTLRDAIRLGKMWGDLIGELTIDEITAKSVRDWRKERLESGFTKGKGESAVRHDYKPATLNRSVDFLRAFLSWCVRQEYIERNVLDAVDSLPEENERLRYLDDKTEEPALKAAMGASWHYAMIAMDTGLRQSEQFRIRREDIDLTHNILHVPHSKTRRRRSVPLTARARRELERLLASHDSPWLYPTPSTHKSRAGDPATYSTVRHVFETALRTAGIANFHWHDLRHTYCSRLAMSGADLATIMQLSGHSSLAACQRYLHVSSGHRQDAVARMDERYGQ